MRDLVVGKTHDGLVPGRETAVLEGAVYVFLVFEPHVHLLYLALFGAVKVKPVPALVLGAVHGSVSLGKEFGCRPPVFRAKRYPYACRHMAVHVRLVKAFTGAPYVLCRFDRLD